jgi:hypothetical protein
MSKSFTRRHACSHTHAHFVVLSFSIYFRFVSVQGPCVFLAKCAKSNLSWSHRHRQAVPCPEVDTQGSCRNGLLFVVCANSIGDESSIGDRKGQKRQLYLVGLCQI